MWQVAAAMGIGSVAKGLIGSRAAKKSARAQRQAILEAQNELRARDANARNLITKGYNDTQQGLTSGFNTLKTDLNNASLKAIDQYKQGQQQFSDTTMQGLQKGTDVYNNAANQAKALFDPYAAAGNNSLAAMQNQDFNRKFTMNDYEEDPGYKFRLQRGVDGLQGSASARGGLFSGAALKALNQYNSDMASQEYGNSYNRFNSSLSDRFNRLQNVAQMGQNAVGNQANIIGTNSSNVAGLIGNAYGNIAERGLGASNNIAQTGLNTANNIGTYQNQLTGNIADLTKGKADTFAGYEQQLGANIGNLIMNRGQVTAAEKIQKANAINDTIGGLVGAAGKYYGNK